MELFENYISRPSRREIGDHGIEREIPIGELGGHEEVDAQEAMRGETIGEEVDPRSIDAKQEDAIIQGRMFAHVGGEFLVRTRRIAAIISIAAEQIEIRRSSQR